MQPLTRTRSSTVGNDGQILHQAREKLEEQRKLQVALKECAKTLRQADSYISKLTKERKNKSGEDFLRLSQMLIAAHQSKDEIKEKCSQQVISLTEQLESMKLTDDEERVQRGHEAMLTAAARKSTAGSIDESQIVTFIDVREKIITQLEKCTEPRERHRFENALSRINADLAMIEKQRRKSSSKPTLSIDTSDTRNPYDALQTAKLKDSVEVQLRLCPEKYEKYHHLCKKTDLEHKVLLDMYSRRQVTRNYKIRPIGASTPTTWKVRCLNHRIKLLKKVWSGQATTDDIIWDRGRRKDADDNITDALRILTPHAQRAATALEELAAEMKLAAESNSRQIEKRSQIDDLSNRQRRVLRTIPSYMQRKPPALAPLPIWKHPPVVEDDILFSYTAGYPAISFSDLSKYDNRLRFLRNKHLKAVEF